MAVTAVNVVGDNTLGNYLKIYSHNSVYSNLSEQSAMWKNILKKRRGPAGGRELRYLLRSAFGAGAAQFVGTVGAVSYPSAAQATIKEGLAIFKDFATTIEVERTLIQKAIDDFRRYGEPLAEELKSKTIATSRMLSASIYQDGTGVIGEVAGAPVISGTPGIITVTLNTGNDARSHVGWFEFGDLIKAATTAGVDTAPAVGAGVFSHFSVEDKNRTDDKIVLAARDAGGLQLDITGLGTIADTNNLRRFGVAAQDTASIVDATEFNTLSEIWPGLESLTQDDNRTVNGIPLTGALKGTRFDAGNDAIDSQDFQNLMSLVKVNTGEGRYRYNDAIMAPEALDALVESRETDRRFNSIQDTWKWLLL